MSNGLCLHLSMLQINVEHNIFSSCVPLLVELWILIYVVHFHIYIEGINYNIWHMPSTHKWKLCRIHSSIAPVNSYKTLRNISVGRHRNGVNKPLTCKLLTNLISGRLYVLNMMSLISQNLILKA
jgi:hypothetical protein